MTNSIKMFGKFLSLLEVATGRSDLAACIIPSKKDQIVELQISFPEDEIVLMVSFKIEDLYQMSDYDIATYISMRYAARLSCLIEHPLTIH